MIKSRVKFIPPVYFFGQQVADSTEFKEKFKLKNYIPIAVVDKTIDQDLLMKIMKELYSQTKQFKWLYVDLNKFGASLITDTKLDKKFIKVENELIEELVNNSRIYLDLRAQVNERDIASYEF